MRSRLKELTVDIGGCPFEDRAAAWLGAALSGWENVNARIFRIETVDPPSILVFDRSCLFTLRPAEDAQTAAWTVGRLSFAVEVSEHEGEIVLPGEIVIPAEVTSFAFSTPDGPIWFVMALPEIWLLAKNSNDPEMLATVVFIHEFTHTQSKSLGGKIDDLIARGLPEDIDDDIIQTRYQADPDFAASIQTELDLLLSAWRSEDLTTARELAAGAVELREGRKRDFFTGDDHLLAELEDVFLTMEGTGQLAAFEWARHAEGGGMEIEAALEFVMREGTIWSQDLGLALFLVLARLDPKWPRLVFRSEPVTIYERLGQVLLR